MLLDYFLTNFNFLVKLKLLSYYEYNLFSSQFNVSFLYYYKL